MRLHKKIFALSLIALSLGFTGCLTDDEDEDPIVTVAWTADTTLTVGAQGHLTLGTAIDLDGKKVLLSAAVNDSSSNFANLRSVDILFAFSGPGANDTLRLLTPKAAKVAGDVGVAANYRDSVINANTTKFVKVTTEPANWDAGKVAFDSAATTAQVTSSVVAANDMFVVKTTSGNYVLVTVGAITGAGGTASTGLTVNLKGL
jgi:hypothetical protein